MSTFKIHMNSITSAVDSEKITALQGSTNVLNDRITNATAASAEAQKDATLALERIGGKNLTGFGTTYRIMEDILDRGEGETGPLVVADVTDLSIPNVSSFLSETQINTRIQNSAASSTNFFVTAGVFEISTGGIFSPVI